MPGPEDIAPGAVLRDPACPYCGHDHHWLDCDTCACSRHDRPGG